MLYEQLSLVEKARSGAGCPVDIRLAPTVAVRGTLTTSNEECLALHSESVVLNSYRKNIITRRKKNG